MTAAPWPRDTFDVRFHGRGGQGVVTAAVMLSLAAFAESRYAQAFPLFGAERMGAPIMAFCRIGDAPIHTPEPIQAPDAVVVADAGLLDSVDVTEGLRPGGLLLVNTTRAARALPLREPRAEHFVRRAASTRASPADTSADRCRTSPCSERWPPSPDGSSGARRSGPSALRRRPRGRQHRRGSRGLSRWRRSQLMRDQLEGSRAVAMTVARCRPWWFRPIRSRRRRTSSRPWRPWCARAS